MAIAAALLFYKGILGKIEQNNYDVFSQRASVSGWGKIKMLPKIWFENSFQASQSFHISSK
jgi:phytoene synthase